MRENRFALVKIWVVLLVTLIVLGSISYFSYTSYQKFDAALEEISTVPDNIGLTEKIFSRLSALETSSRAYALTLSDQDYGEYFLKAQNAQLYIDSLAYKSATKSYKRQVDTLRILFQEKLSSFDDLINYKLAQNREAEPEAIEYLNQSTSLLTKDTVLTPVKKEEKVLVVDTTDRPNFLQRLFGAKPKEKLETRTLVTYDTVYQERIDTLLQSVKLAITKAEKRREVADERLTDRELLLVNKDQVIVNKLQKLMNSIRAKEKLEAKAQKESTALEAKQSFRSVVGFASVGGLLTLLLVFLVAKDFNTAQRLQQALALEKEKAEELGKAKENFLASMSHEIRTPLNAVIGFTEQIENGKLAPEQRHKLGLVRQSGQHLLTLVNDILDFSKIEAGKLTLEAIGFNPHQILKECVEVIKPLSNEKDLKLKTEVQANLEDVLVVGDPFRLKQVLINLLSNAVKFTDKGFVMLKLSGKLEGDEAILHFEVIDTGRGISTEKQASIFEGFSQEDNSITRKYGGSGLGLSISQSLLRLHNATLRVTSRLGKGANFWFDVTYPITANNDYVETTNINKESTSFLANKTLLLIDDDKMNHMLLEPYFKEHGIKYSTAFDGASGLTLAAKTTFDYVLVDLQMPGLSGYEVVEQLRTSGGKSAYSYVVLCTANALVQQQNHPMLKKIDAVLLKPFNEERLLQVLKQTEDKAVNNQVVTDVAVAEELEPLSYSLDNFKAFASGDDAMLRQFVCSFIEHAQEGIKELENACAEKDFVTVAETAHRLKNTYAQLHAHAALQLLKKLESLREEIPPNPKEVVQNCIEAFSATSKTLFAHLKDDLELVNL